MKTYALLAVFGFGAVLLAAPSCSNNAPTGGAGGSSGGSSTGGTAAGGSSTGGTAAGGSSTGGTAAGGSSTGGTAGTAAGGSGGGSCAASLQLGSAACNACAPSACCDEETNCDTPDQPAGGAAGTSGCATLASCVSECLVGNADAGTPDCFDSCNPSHVYNVTQITNAQILIACLSNGCASSCR